MPLTKDEIRSLLSDIENERVERTLATFKVIVQNADIIENGTNVIEKTPNVIVNVTGSGTDDTNDVTNSETIVTNNVTNSETIVTNNVTNSETIVTNDVTNNGDSRKEAVIKMMRKNKRVSVTQIAKELNVTRRTIFRLIDVLKTENRIKRVGDLKSGTWEVIE